AGLVTGRNLLTSCQEPRMPRTSIESATTAYSVFETPVGACGIAWSARGVRGLQLPEGSADATRARLRRRFPHAVESEAPPNIVTAITRIVALLRGERIDLKDIPLDMD